MNMRKQASGVFFRPTYPKDFANIIIRL